MFDSSCGWVEEGHWWHEGGFDGGFSCIVGLGGWQVVDVGSDSGQEFPGLVLFGEQEFNVV